MQGIPLFSDNMAAQSTYLKVRWWNIRSFIILQYLLLTPKYSQDRATPLEHQNKGQHGAIGNLEYGNRNL